MGKITGDLAPGGPDPWRGGGRGEGRGQGGGQNHW